MRGGAVLAAAALVPLTASPATTALSRADSELEVGSSRLAQPVLLARPGGGGVFKGRNLKWRTAPAAQHQRCHATEPLCVHWTTGTDDAPPTADSSPANGVPDQVDDTLAAAGTAWKVIVEDLGFRAPLPDDRSRFDGGDKRFDIYLADTGARKLSGYVSSDDPRLSDKSSYKFADVSAFMVIDNDFRSSQFPKGTVADNLRATVAHELFHASQFAYDHAEDKWFTEGTATWVEDEVFDDVNLNRGSLNKSASATPTTPLDLGRRGYEYGSWLFFRYLSEKFGPGIIRQAWRQADDSAAQVSTDRLRTYSTRALARALAKKGRDLHTVFAGFMRDNLTPKKTYDEGATYPKPTPVRVTVSRHNHGNTGWLSLPLDHLSSVYVTLVPGKKAPVTGKLRLRVDGPGKASGPKFVGAVRFANGHSKNFAIGLNRSGEGTTQVAFGRKRVAGVDVAMVNSSTRMKHCFPRHRTSLACGGRPQDDDRPYRLRGSLVR